MIYIFSLSLTKLCNSNIFVNQLSNYKGKPKLASKIKKKLSQRGISLN